MALDITQPVLDRAALVVIPDFPRGAGREPPRPDAVTRTEAREPFQSNVWPTRLTPELSEPGDAQTPPARGPTYTRGEAMPEVSQAPRSREAALRCEAAQKLLDHADAGEIDRVEAEHAATGLLYEAIDWLRGPAA